MGMYCILVFIIYNCDNIFNFYDRICYKNLIYYLIFCISICVFICIVFLKYICIFSYVLFVF